MGQNFSTGRQRLLRIGSERIKKGIGEGRCTKDEDRAQALCPVVGPPAKNQESRCDTERDHEREKYRSLAGKGRGRGPYQEGRDSRDDLQECQ